MIEALYRASGAGVRVEIVVRGICALRAGVPGLSENIHVRSILGRFLEHSRVLHFRGADELLLGSADMMHRNLDRRVEVMSTVTDPRLKAQLARVLDSALQPETRSFHLMPDASWARRPERADWAASVDHQERMLAEHKGTRDR